MRLTGNPHSHYTHESGGTEAAVLPGAWHLYLAHTRAHSLMSQPESQVLAGLMEEMPAPFFSASPGTLHCPSASSEAMSAVWASCRGCDSGLGQAEAGCQRHSLGHEESHSSIYRQCTCWPGPVGGSGCCRLQQVRGMGAASPEPE